MFSSIQVFKALIITGAKGVSLPLGVSLSFSISSFKISSSSISIGSSESIFWVKRMILDAIVASSASDQDTAQATVQAVYIPKTVWYGLNPSRTASETNWIKASVFP